MGDIGSADQMVFKFAKGGDGVAARLGTLKLAKSAPLETPNFIDITSRGAIPHLTTDVLTKHVQVNGAYMAIEDFVEKYVKRPAPAIFSASENGRSRLHSYTGLPSETITVMGARRYPAVVAPMGNGAKHLSILTSTGFQSLEIERYCDNILSLRPDIVIPLADLTFDKKGTRSNKRLRRMLERTDEWVEAFFKTLDPDTKLKPLGIHVFAPTLPVEYPLQWEYLNRLSEDHAHKLGGLVVYDADILADLEAHAPLVSLPRLSLDSPNSPHEILRQIQMGIDIFAIPFMNGISDEGIALSFSFPAQTREGPDLLPLGVNLWSKEHQVSVAPLVKGCSCYACTKHHRAFICHLLDAREMLSWTLLQIHNHHTLTEFFRGVRAAIGDGTFDQKVEDFTKAYDPEFPHGTGERPRTRGYHFKSEASQPKANVAPWRAYEDNNGEDQALKMEAAGLVVTGGPEVDADAPLVPESTAEVKDSGFAEEAS